MDADPVNSLYGPNFDFPIWEGDPLKSFMIAAIPRSGSTLFAVDLWRTGVLGSPMEYTNFLNRRTDMLVRLGQGDGVRYWKELIRHRTSPNGVFSFKCFIADYKQAMGIDRKLLPYIKSDETIYITRRDKTAQAISYARALQTGKWYAKGREAFPPRYSEKSIEDATRWLRHAEESWERLFHVKGCEPIRVVYEDYLSDPMSTIHAVIEKLGVGYDKAASVELPEIHMQRDSINADWHARLMAAQKPIDPSL